MEVFVGEPVDAWRLARRGLRRLAVAIDEDGVVAVGGMVDMVLADAP